MAHGATRFDTRLACWIGLFCVATSALAHSPHDVIKAVAAVNRADGAAIVFAIVADDVLMRSSDGGLSWVDLSCGLDNRHPWTAVDAARGPNGVTVVAGTDGDGVFGSIDGGDTWQTLSAGLPGRRIRTVRLLDPSGLLLAIDHSGDLYRSNDLGTTWGRVEVPQANVTAVAYLVPGDSEALVIGTADGHLLRYEPSTSQWREADVPAGMGAVTAIATSTAPQDPLILAATELAGVLRSADGGRRFERASSGLTELNVPAVGILPGTATAFAVGWNEAAFRSLDGGVSWNRFSRGLTTDEQANDPLHLSPQFNDVALVPGDRSAPMVFIAGFDGLFRSSDNGENWTELETLTPGRIMDMAVSPSHEGDHCLALATYGAGAYMRCSRDTKWHVLNRGLNHTRLTGMSFAVSDVDPITLFAGAPGQILVHRGAGASAWQTIRLTRGLWSDLLVRGMNFLNRQLGLPRSLTLDLLDKKVNQKPFPEALALPATPSSESVVFFSTRRHGLMRASVQTGETTVLRDSDRLLGRVLTSPAFSRDRTLMLAARLEGLLVSRDGGDTWDTANQGLEFLGAWKRLESEPDRLHEVERSPAFQMDLAISPGFERDGTVFLGSSLGMYRSTDRALSWRHVGRGLPSTPYLLGVALSPDYENDRTVIASVKGEGVMVSRDGGHTFFHLAEPDERIRLSGVSRVAFSPDFGSDRTLYAASQHSVFMSADGGRTWSLLDRPVRYEGTRGVVRFRGDWTPLTGRHYSANSAWTTAQPGSEVTLRFFGTGLDVWAHASPVASVAVEMDGRQVTTKTVSVGRAPQPGLLTRHRRLECNSHRLSIRLRPAPSDGADAPHITLDAIDVLGSDCRQDEDNGTF